MEGQDNNNTTQAAPPLSMLPLNVTKAVKTDQPNLWYNMLERIS